MSLPRIATREAWLAARKELAPPQFSEVHRFWDLRRIRR
jgi:hypothetical protein